jgi:hypothetical protein
MLMARKLFDRLVVAATLLTGLAFFLAPWLLGYAEHQVAAAVTWVLAGTVTITALLALSGPAPWGGLILVLAGLVALLAPTMFGFLTAIRPLLVHMVAGLLLLAEGYLMFRLRGADIM